MRGIKTGMGSVGLVGRPIVRYMSDLHLEFNDIAIPAMEVDYTILAGDIFVAGDPVSTNRFRRLVAFLMTECNSNIIYIPGNHEFYNGRLANCPFFSVIGDECRAIDSIRDSMAGETKAEFICLTEALGCMHIDEKRKVAFVGDTLWTDFDRENPMSMYAAQRGMNCFSAIKFRDQHSEEERTFTPQDALFLHKNHLHRIEQCLEKVSRMDDQEIVPIVVTHHAPSFRSVSKKFVGHPLNGAFCSNLDYHPTMSMARYWVHGHVHSSHKYENGNCTVLCNPRGYTSVYGGSEDTGFDPCATFVAV